MNGVGLFATRALSPTFFVEGGLDAYFGEPWPQAQVEGALPIDRVSALVSVAIGVRTQVHPRVLAYAQVGAGVEVTQLEVPYGDSSLHDRQALPDGYVGIGGELRVGARTHLGTTLRVHAMGNFAYDPATLDMQAGWATPPTAEQVFDASPDVAAQMLFYVRTDR